MFSNTKTRDVRKFSRKPQSKFVASRKSQKLKRRDEIETKYTDDRFVAFESYYGEVRESETDLSNLDIINLAIAELEYIYNSINVNNTTNDKDFLVQNQIDNITYILEKY